MTKESFKWFCSYAREDAEFVMELAKELREVGASLWLDQMDIVAGSRWDESVEGALVSCEGMLAVLSPSSVASQNFMDEVSYALQENKQVIPVLYRECAIPFRLQRVQRVDLTGDYDKGFANLSRALGLEQPDETRGPRVRPRPEEKQREPVEVQEREGSWRGPKALKPKEPAEEQRDPDAEQRQRLGQGDIAGGSHRAASKYTTILLPAAAGIACLAVLYLYFNSKADEPKVEAPVVEAPVVEAADVKAPDDVDREVAVEGSNSEASDTVEWVPPDGVQRFKVPLEGNEPQRGPDDALVTIVEFGNFECQFSRRAETTLKQVRDKYGEDVRVVWMNNPLPMHPNAKRAAIAALEAYAQKGNRGFWAMHKKMFANQKALTVHNLEKWAAELGLNLAHFRQALEEDKYRQTIEAQQALAESLEATGTPWFFINGRGLRGFHPPAAFTRLIDEELPKAKRLVRNGIPKAKVYDEIMARSRSTPY